MQDMGEDVEGGGVAMSPSPQAAARPAPPVLTARVNQVSPAQDNGKDFDIEVSSVTTDEEDYPQFEKIPMRYLHSCLFIFLTYAIGFATYLGKASQYDTSLRAIIVR